MPCVNGKFAGSAGAKADAGALRRVLRVLTCLLALTGAVCLLVVATPLVRWLMPHPAGAYDPPSGTDTLVVLGAGAQDGLPDLESYWRCVYVVRFYRNGGIRRIILSGGASQKGEPPVAEAMASYLRSAGVKAEDIVCENRAQSTRENALYVAELLNKLLHGEVALVTSDYHSRRASAVFRKAGVVHSSVSIPYITKLSASLAERPALFLLLIVEESKHVWYGIRHWV